MKEGKEENDEKVLSAKCGQGSKRQQENTDFAQVQKGQSLIEEET